MEGFFRSTESQLRGPIPMQEKTELDWTQSDTSDTKNGRNHRVGLYSFGTLVTLGVGLILFENQDFFESMLERARQNFPFFSDNNHGIEIAGMISSSSSLELGGINIEDDPEFFKATIIGTEDLTGNSIDGKGFGTLEQVKHLEELRGPIGPNDAHYFGFNVSDDINKAMDLLDGAYQELHSTSPEKLQEIESLITQAFLVPGKDAAYATLENTSIPLIRDNVEVFSKLVFFMKDMTYFVDATQKLKDAVDVRIFSQMTQPLIPTVRHTDGEVTFVLNIGAHTIYYGENGEVEPPHEYDAYLGKNGPNAEHRARFKSETDKARLTIVYN